MRIPTNEEVAVLAETIVRGLDDMGGRCEHAEYTGPCFDCRAGLVAQLIVGAVFELEHARPLPTANSLDGR